MINRVKKQHALAELEAMQVSEDPRIAERRRMDALGNIVNPHNVFDSTFTTNEYDDWEPL